MTRKREKEKRRRGGREGKEGPRAKQNSSLLKERLQYVNPIVRNPMLEYVMLV
jgi:hypothetical protein